LERCHVWAEELDELRRVARVQHEEEAETEYAELRNRLDRIEAQLAAMETTDPEFYSAHVAATRALLSRRG
jgi:flagellar biosynthesis chaperone FliJ